MSKRGGRPTCTSRVSWTKPARARKQRATWTRWLQRPRSRSVRLKKKVHPAEARAAGRTVKTKLSDQFVPGLVDRQDLQLEELLVAEPIRLPLHRLDLVVRPLHRTGRDHHVVVGQQPTPVRRQWLSPLLAHLDPRRLRTL